jgi:hypothetical protein
MTPVARGLQTFFRYFPISGRDRLWGLYLTTAGESRIPPGAPYPPTGHPGGYHFDWRRGRVLREYQFVYISAGRGVLEIARNRWRIGSGQAFVLFPGVRHRYRPDPRTGWSEHWIGCDGPIVRGLVRHRFFSPRKPVLRVREEDLLLAAFTSVIDSVHAGRPALQQVTSSAALYIMSLLYSAQQPGQAGGDERAVVSGFDADGLSLLRRRVRLREEPHHRAGNGLPIRSGDAAAHVGAPRCGVRHRKGKERQGGPQSGGRRHRYPNDDTTNRRRALQGAPVGTAITRPPSRACPTPRFPAGTWTSARRWRP